MTERFYNHAVAVVGAVLALLPPDAQVAEVESEFEGTFFTHYRTAPSLTNLSVDTQWLATQGEMEWIEVRQVAPLAEARAVILRCRTEINTGDVYFVATDDEAFLMMQVMFQTPPA